MGKGKKNTGFAKEGKSFYRKKSDLSIIRIIQHYKYLKKNGCSLRILLLFCVNNIVVLTLGALIIGILMPLAHGIITQDFTFITEVFIIGGLIESLVGDTKESFILFVFLSSLLFILATLKSFASYFGDIYKTKYLNGIAKNIHIDLYKRYVGMGRPFFNRINFGRESIVMSRLPQTVFAVLAHLDKIVSSILSLIMYGAIIIFLSVHLAVVAFLLVAIFGVIVRILSRGLVDRGAELVESELKIPQVLYNSIARMPLSFIFGKEQWEVNLFSRAAQKLEDTRIYFQVILGKLEPINDFSRFMVLLVFASILGSLSFSNQSPQISKYLVSFYVFSIFVGFSIAITQNYMDLLVRLASMSRLTRQLSEHQNYRIMQGNKQADLPQRKIMIKDLKFSYDAKNEVLARCSFEIEMGKVNLIVGKTGSGKTTFVDLLMKFYDVPSRSIFFDEIDVNTYTNKSVRFLFAYVDQNPLVFNASLYKNIVYGSQISVSEKKVKELIHDLDLDHFVSRLPRGIHSLLGDRGSTVSGGEAQRIAIARALLKRAPILILDEATSGLDPQTQQKVLRLIKNKYNIRTIIMISHSVSVVPFVDRVVTFESGRIIEQGEVQELIRSKGYFYKSIHNQLKLISK